MGATTSEVKTNLGVLLSLLEEVVEVLENLNEKSWSGTTNELITQLESQVALESITDVSNNTTVKGGGTVSTTVFGDFNNVLDATKLIEPFIMAVQEELNKKDWNGAETKLEDLETNITTLNSAFDTFVASAGDTTNAGANLSETVAAVRSARGTIFFIHEALKARIGKKYKEGNRLINIAKDNIVDLTAEIAAIQNIT